ncbi:3-hydroxyacyl-CoA dehydrogenase family protein [Salinibacterium sp. M195]|uniref:3-hydroxyacyl-CoA dehydrogenase family protein n=1 Tax=Salinibacterium sp. M195 TaxID=2583374 RepID=UPI001C63B718|nr:3-hydroxyacyl-CoA dehydrogenase NAD-binding domain-containing protein [Salinibacterium sp. M195]QYH35283.1 3-hydroxyacyl-CoA dehydrogenase [Salinibacterium sp. M195]
MINVRENQVAVIGLGTMGKGISRLLLQADYEVHVHDPFLADEAPSGARVVSSIEECVSGASVVFEAVSEDLDVKAKVLRTISHATDGLIASNTSTFMPSVLADSVLNPERFLVGHFFNPADIIPLVEVVPHPKTRPESVDLFTSLLLKLGKRPVLLSAERPGFVANRLQAAVLREALSLVEAGVVTAADIDAIVTSGLAARWAAVGPIGVADLGGLDIFRAVCTQIFPSLDNSATPNALLVDRVTRGELGAKSSSGFYQHSASSVAAVQEAVTRILSVQQEIEQLTPATSVERAERGR